MSSRQEEKEQRRQERLQREAAAEAAAKRRRLLQLIGGVVVGCAIVAGVVFAMGSGGASKDVDDAAMRAAATRSGCVYRSFPEEGREHSAAKLTAADYKTNPPTSGTHNPTPAGDGLYIAGNEPEIPNWVHTLEHGRIIFQYKPGTGQDVVAQLTSLFNENVAGSGGAYHSVLMQNNSNMTPQVAAVAWRHSMTCAKFTPRTIAALRAFRDELVDKGPETVP